MIQEKEIEKGAVLWKVSGEAKFAIIIMKGSFIYVDYEEDMVLNNVYNLKHEELTCGTFVGEVKAMYENRLLTTSLKAVRNGLIFIIDKQSLMDFLTRHPGLLIHFQDKKYII